MSAPARLLALRLQGFKSFANRTIVEFGPGISAVVGPNGSGKSNLADALRWALGEQGRTLRSRRSEDLIFAGSDGRAAVGMADVAIVLDNGDGLLPVEYSVVELGRRLFRSGENEFLLNRTRVRLRDLVDLLEAARLADNAFLFIGQGMVDQALAMRPEERRPLFEEVAGVRRHERRRRAAEERLAEAELNLSRVRDVLAELRPQLRRLAAQAQQQVARVRAGEELAAALVAAARVRWHESARRSQETVAALTNARVEADAAMAMLRSAEEEALELTRSLEVWATGERERRVTLDTIAREANATLVRQAGATAAMEGLERDRRRFSAERKATEERLVEARRRLAVPAPEADSTLEEERDELERQLAEVAAELARLRVAGGSDDGAAVLRQVAQVTAAERDAARRRLAEVERRLAEEREVAAGAVEAARRAAGTRDREASGLADGAARAAAALADVAARRAMVIAAEGRLSARAARVAAARGAEAELASRLAGTESRLAQEERGIVAAARRRGGRPVLEGLEIDREARRAVEAALGAAGRGAVVAAQVVAELADERGTIVVAGSGRPLAEGEARDPVAAALASGGGPLGEAVRRDPDGTARRLLARAVWVPDLAAAIRVLPALPSGWRAATLQGDTVEADGVVRIGAPPSLLEERAEQERLASAVLAAREELRVGSADLAATQEEVSAARTALAQATRAAQEAEAAHRRAEEAERHAVGAAELAAREQVWHEAQVARLEAEAERLTERARLSEAHRPSEMGRTRSAGAIGGHEPTAQTGSGHRDVTTTLGAWVDRERQLLRRRALLQERLEAATRVRRQQEAELHRAAERLALDEARLEALARELGAVAAQETAQRLELDDVEMTLARLAEQEAEARTALEALAADGVGARDRLVRTDRAARVAREQLRAADMRSRSAEVEELEARLALDAVREQLLVELAALGRAGLAALTDESGSDTGGSLRTDGRIGDGADEPGAFDRALDGVAERWATEPPPPEAPSPVRLAALRRRYHDLGAANPFALEEHAALQRRVDELESQRDDLERAIEGTRSLIGELDRLITEQFLATFRALEDAFDRRFRLLFGGGYARLSLTDPSDVSETGVEIVARPPGKKAQALAMLSGGERALTAVALLFAMLEVRPVPFCVLDEVDAALDEANIARFTDSLRELAEKTQFVIITHNRGTIEQADALYGITIGDDAVSRLVALRLDEAASWNPAGPTPHPTRAAVVAGPGTPIAASDATG